MFSEYPVTTEPLGALSLFVVAKKESAVNDVIKHIKPTLIALCPQGGTGLKPLQKRSYQNNKLSAVYLRRKR